MQALTARLFFMSYPTDISITDSKNFANFSATCFTGFTMYYNCCKLLLPFGFYVVGFPSNISIPPSVDFANFSASPRMLFHKLLTLLISVSVSLIPLVSH